MRRRRSRAAAPGAARPPDCQCARAATHLGGDPLEVAVYVGNPGTVKEALLYVRREGDYTYQRLPLSADATGYYRILVPPRLRTAGTVELFVGLIDTTGHQSIFAGSADQPSDVVIEPPVGPPPSPGPNHSAVSGFFEFVDFTASAATTTTSTRRPTLCIGSAGFCTRSAPASAR